MGHLGSWYGRIHGDYMNYPDFIQVQFKLIDEKLWGISCERPDGRWLNASFDDRFEALRYLNDMMGRHYVERCTRIDHDKTMVIESWEFA